MKISIDGVTHFWRIRKWVPERFGQQCRLLACGRLNSALIEFADGAKVTTNRRFIRRLKPKDER